MSFTATCFKPLNHVVLTLFILSKCDMTQELESGVLDCFVKVSEWHSNWLASGAVLHTGT